MLPRRIPPPDPAERYLLELIAGASPRPPASAGAAFWDRLLRMIAAHRLAEHLYASRTAGRWWADWPAAVRAELRQRYVQTALRHAQYRQELSRLLPPLATRGIAPVLLKGGALALTVCADPAERPYGDLDVLVRRHEVDEAAAVLRANGYVVDERFQTEAFYRRHHYHLIFRRRDRSWLCFEVHWDLTLPLMDTGIDAQALLERAVTATAGDLRVRVPCPEDLLLHLALHASLGCFGHLGQILDVSRLVGRPPDLDGARLWDTAVRWRVARPLRASLMLATLFGPSPQAARLLAVDPGRGGGQAARTLLRPVSLLRQRTVRSMAGSTALSLWRRDRPRDRWHFLARQLRPSAAEIALDGHTPLPPHTPPLRQVIDGSYLLLKTAVWIALTAAGMEVEPRVP